MSTPAFGIRITASDDTAKGVKSAEKNVGRIPKSVGQVNARAMRDVDRAVTQSGRNMTRTFGQVERSIARTFGGGGTALGSRMGGAVTMARSMGSAFSYAAAEGEGLSASAGMVGGVLTATVGVMAAAVVGAIKLGSSWASGAAKMGRMADIIGVSTKGLQEFAAAGELVGIDKDKSMAGLGSLSQTLNDAKYGRNTGALATLSRLGVGMRTKANGDVDVEAMLPDIANAMQRLSPSGMRTVASHLGLPPELISMFSQGGKSLSSDMRASDDRAAMLSPDDIAMGKRIQRRGAIAGQLVDRHLVSAAGRLSAQGIDTVESLVADGMHSFDSGSRTIDRAAGKMDRAANTMARSYPGDHGPVAGIIRRAAASAGRDGDGMVAIAAHESHLDPGIHAPGSTAVGLFQMLEQTWLGLVKQHGAAHEMGWAASAISRDRRGRWTVGDPALRSRILGLRSDPYANATMAAEMMNDQDRVLSKVLGRAPMLGESYLANFLGPGGASKFLRLDRQNGGASAAAAFPREAAANHSVFYNRSGGARSLDEVLRLLSSFVEQAARPIRVDVQVSAPRGHGASARVTGGHGSVSYAYRQPRHD